MTAPSKPWEVPGINVVNRQFDGTSTLSSSSNPLQNVPPVTGAGPSPSHLRQIPLRQAPPLPPRTRSSRIPLGGYPSSYVGSYGSNYSGFGGYGGYGTSYGGYGSYGGFGGYGMNHFGFPRGNNPESRFIQMAEEGSRPAFQSIESIVQAFCSVSFMMESTFNAMYSSFRAVLGVAENFGHLRSVFGQFLSVFAIFRWFRWLYKKCLYLLGLDSTNPNFNGLFPNPEGGAEVPKRHPLSWPVVFFLTIVFTGPYLMWKLLNSLNIPSLDPYSFNDWRKSQKPVFSAVVMFDFMGASDQELNIQAGQRILIAPKELQPRGLQNWLIALKGNKIGLVPANYIQIVGRVVFSDEKSQKSTIPQQSLPPKPEVLVHVPGPDGDASNLPNILPESMKSDGSNHPSS